MTIPPLIRLFTNYTSPTKFKANGSPRNISRTICCFRPVSRNFPNTAARRVTEMELSHKTEVFDAIFLQHTAL